MQQQEQIDDLGFCPSFNCYSSSSTAAARISTQLHHDADQDEFEFSTVLGDEQSSASGRRTSFPLFNSNLLATREEETETACSDSSSDSESPGVFCVWRHKTDTGGSPLSKCKKSGSTGSGSKRWRIRDLLRRSNSEGKEPMVMLSRKKIGEGSAGAGKSKASVHELLYVQQRAKREGDKRRSYLPYRQGLVGFFSNVNGSSGKKLPF